MSSRKPYFAGALMALMGLGFAFSASAASQPDFKRTARPFLEKYCYECHGGKQTKADLDLKAIKDDHNLIADHKMWRNVIGQINSGEMPPKKASLHPSHDDIELFNKAMDNAFDVAQSKMPVDPGHVTVRRLNRKEYNNTIRDLIGVDFNPSENFPADDIGHGFDNIGDVLSISPVHLERYLDAAESIATRAALLELPKPPNRSTSSNFLQPYGYGSESTERPITNAYPELWVQQDVKAAGEYKFIVRAHGTNAPGAEPPKLMLLVDDKEFATVVVTNTPGTGTGGFRSRSREYEVTLPLEAGTNKYAVRFLNRSTNSATGVANNMVIIREIKVVGPADTRSDLMKRVDAIRANKADSEQTHLVVDWFLTHAFRRPPTKEETARYEKVFADGQAANNKWEGGLQQLVKVALCSPKFLFRVELDDRPKTKESHALDEFQLASRLSYFLWSSMPDEELLALAAKKQLSAKIDDQVKRMLKDVKAGALVQNFGLQWLQLERLSTFSPDKSIFPDFDDRLKKSMLRETELFLGEIFQQDHSVLDLVDADFTYVNRTLARLYGIDDPRLNNDYRGYGRRRGGGGGDEFVRVGFTNKLRGGLLTQASVLTVTSNPTRTSPVKRGKWVLEQILGTPPPPPPPGVQQLEQQQQLTGTLRQRMEQHRTDPRCANCHQQMDAMGFAFENFDGIGRFRGKDAGADIDPSGVLPDGSKFQGPAQLKEVLKGKKELVARNITEKLMIYALGRGLEYYDERAVRKIVTDMGKDDYKFSALVSGIVKSDPFRLQRGTKLNEVAAGAE